MAPLSYAAQQRIARIVCGICPCSYMIDLNTLPLAISVSGVVFALSISARLRPTEFRDVATPFGNKDGF